MKNFLDSLWGKIILNVLISAAVACGVSFAVISLFNGGIGHVHVYDSEDDLICNTCAEKRKVSFSAGLKYTKNSDGTYTVRGLGSCEDADIIIPEKHDGAAVTSVAPGAFGNCVTLKSIVIPDSVTSIGNSAFAVCTSLTSITIPDSVTSIGAQAFYNCASLTSITIPDSVTSIDDYAFYNCTSLTFITIPDSVTSIGNHAFYNCTSLASITIPDSVTSIDDYAFDGCSALTGVTIPNSVTGIGYSAFNGCTSLQYNEYDNALYLGNETNPYVALIKAKDTSITACTIHDDTKIIYRNAFSLCESLTSVTIGNSVTSIGDRAFYYCKKLTSITIPDSVTSIGDYAFWFGRDLTSISFDGTIAQWSAISKSDDWYGNADSYKVYCTDGVVSPR